jgi:hypothetical protein
MRYMRHITVLLGIAMIAMLCFAGTAGATSKPSGKPIVGGITLNRGSGNGMAGAPHVRAESAHLPSSSLPFTGAQLLAFLVAACVIITLGVALVGTTRLHRRA